MTATNEAGLTDTATFFWTIVALPPVLTAPGYQSNSEQGAVNFGLSATDPGNYAVTFSATGLPAGLTINTLSGVISGTIAPGSLPLVDFSVTLAGRSIRDGSVDLSSQLGV